MLNINSFKKRYDEQKGIGQKPKQEKPVKEVKNVKKDDSLTYEEIDNYSILFEDD